MCVCVHQLSGEQYNIGYVIQVAGDTLETIVNWYCFTMADDFDYSASTQLIY